MSLSLQTDPTFYHLPASSSNPLEFETLYGRNPCPTLLLDSENKIISCNAAAKRKPVLNEFLNHAIYDLFPDFKLPTDLTNPVSAYSIKLTTRDKLNDFELSLCSFGDKFVIFIKADKKQSKLEQILHTPYIPPSKPCSKPPKRPAPQATSPQGSPVSKKTSPDSEGPDGSGGCGDQPFKTSHLPAYTLSRTKSNIKIKSQAPLSAKSKENTIVGLTQLFLDTIHEIRNALSSPISTLDDLKEALEEQSLDKAKEITASFSDSLAKILQIIDERVEREVNINASQAAVSIKDKIPCKDKKLLRILVAEDNEVSFKVLKKRLNDFGFSDSCIERAKDGEEALEKSSGASQPFDLIFMDIHMPNLDGNGAAKAILEKNPSIPIIACTGATKEEIAKQLFIQTIAKPIKKEDLEKSLNNLFDFSAT